METIKGKNPFEGYLKRMQKNYPTIRVNPVHEIVNQFFIIKKLDKKPKSFYLGRFGYPKLCKEAKKLLENCGWNLEDALWSLDKMNYKAEQGGYDWSISTCLKHDLGWGTK